MSHHLGKRTNTHGLSLSLFRSLSLSHRHTHTHMQTQVAQIHIHVHTQSWHATCMLPGQIARRCGPTIPAQRPHLVQHHIGGFCLLQVRPGAKDRSTLTESRALPTGCTSIESSSAASACRSHSRHLSLGFPVRQWRCTGSQRGRHLSLPTTAGLLTLNAQCHDHQRRATTCTSAYLSNTNVCRLERGHGLVERHRHPPGGPSKVDPYKHIQNKLHHIIKLLHWPSRKSESEDMSAESVSRCSDPIERSFATAVSVSPAASATLYCTYRLRRLPAAMLAYN